MGYTSRMPLPRHLPEIELPPITCGLIVNTPHGWLLGRATGLGHWDLPKGKAEPGEPHIQAALRECMEETGLDFSAWHNQMEDLGLRSYHKKRGKRLQLFRLNLDFTPNLDGCTCTTLVHTRGEHPVPDMDAWAWVAPTSVSSLVNSRMARHLQKRGLIPGSPCAKTGDGYTGNALPAHFSCHASEHD